MAHPSSSRTTRRRVSGIGGVAWVTGSFVERDQVIEALNRDGTTEPRDVLGVGRIRDVYSDAFFPGVTTQQTRAKYFLFAACVCKKVEKGKGRGDAWSRLRRYEQELMFALKRGDDDRGLVGRNSARLPERTATEIYWGGIHTWGLRHRRKNLSWYCHWVNSGMRVDGVALMEEGGDERHDDLWDRRLLEFESVLEEPIIGLSRTEAKYLKDKIRAIERPDRQPILKELLPERQPWLLDDLWKIPSIIEGRLDLALEAADAGRLSTAMEGAVHIYNAALPTESNDRREAHEQDFASWLGEHPSNEWESWDVKASLERLEALPGGQWAIAWKESGEFIQQLRTLLAKEKKGSGIPSELTRLIRRREQKVKGANARTASRQPLPLWELDAATAAGRLSYRWHSARRILDDIANPL